MNPLGFLRTTRGRVGFALVASVVISAVWLAFGLPIAILPALVGAQWVPVMARQEPVSPSAKRLLVVAVAAGVLLLLLGVGLLAAVAIR